MSLLLPRLASILVAFGACESRRIGLAFAASPLRKSLLCVVLSVGCGDDSTATDAAVDAPTDTTQDTTQDTVQDAAQDAVEDVASDVFVFDANFMRADATVMHPLDDLLRLNHLQVEGTHNSYHVRPSPTSIPDWNYTNAALDEQLDSQGVRAIELDVYLHEDGFFEVNHVPVLDDVRTCRTLLECLSIVRRWSDAHVAHHPIFIQIEPKDFYDEATNDDVMALMEEEILSVFPVELLVTPGMVQGAAASLREAVTTTGWPTLGEVRGRVLFFLNCERDWCVHYATGSGRLIFADANADDPWASVRVINAGGDEARTAVEAGFIVRSRALSVPSAFELSAAELDAQLADVLAVGAHIVSTDIPIARDDVPRFVEMPGGTPSRCNPITAPTDCTAESIENPAVLAP